VQVIRRPDGLPHIALPQKDRSQPQNGKICGWIYDRLGCAASAWEMLYLGIASNQFFVCGGDSKGIDRQHCHC
jgi:hypothetical protein